MIKSCILSMFACVMSLTSCSDDKRIEALVNPTPEIPVEEPDLDEDVDRGVAYGADISWITAQEKKGVSFYDLDGNETDMLSRAISLSFFV